ncbi:hypothetical protein E4U09_000163 [Claviceps aff. purpurea]|uniref:DRPLA protein n=1 Tax=Claviceps aff. purpurea TaxID=1967640 RepID=A0A9P7TZB8_9HYPO|nr:hypothetical protein E4U09_000163 [Claviceps aff. purpurea]
MESRESNDNRQDQLRTTWTEDEDALLIQLGSSKHSWKEIAGRFPGRTIKSCTGHYERIMEREEKTELAILYESHKEEMWTKVAERLKVSEVSWRDAEINHWRIGQAEMRRRVGNEFLTEVCIDLPQLGANNHEAQEQIQQQCQQQRPRNPWSGDEEAILLAKHRKGIKWKDISSDLPGRTPKACSCQHRYLLTRCGGWSPELQNRFCKEYDRLKQEMWMHIGEKMSVPWQNAEEMHWGLIKHGIVEIAGVTLTHPPAANLTISPRERGQTTKEWLNVVCQSED